MSDIKTTSGKMRSITPKSYEKMEAVESDYAFPRLSFNQSDIPESEEWDVGETYTLQVQVTLKRIEQRGDDNCVDFAITKVKAL